MASREKEERERKVVVLGRARVMFYLGAGLRTATTWRSSSGGSGRRAWPAAKGQGEGQALHQRFKGNGERPLARGQVRGRPIGLGGRRRTRARQVFDVESVSWAQAIAAKRSREKSWGGLGSTRVG